MSKHAKKKSKRAPLFALTKLDKKRLKAKMKRMREKKRAKLALLRLNKDEEDNRISEDDCDFDFDRSTRPLCSTSEDDSDGPQGSRLV
jgi:hypothetical protein